MVQKKILKKNPDQLLCIFDDGTVSLENVLSISGNELETSNRVLDISGLDKFVNVSGSIFYATNLNVSARSDSEDLKLLRRSVVLKNLFNYSGKKDFDLFSFLPWVIILALIIFK